MKGEGAQGNLTFLSDNTLINRDSFSSKPARRSLDADLFLFFDLPIWIQIDGYN